MVLTDSYFSLPAQFFSRIDPSRVPTPRLIHFNAALAEELDLELDAASSDPATPAEIFSGNRLLPGSKPIAMVYAGHQFGQFVPQLGDGRAILIAEVRDRRGQRRDIQLKGAGRTPYSRSGDGRAALGPVLREYLVSEAMHALGVPTTRSLAAVVSGEAVYRETPLPGAILTRVAASHIRVGTFEYFAARGDVISVRRLADYVIDRHYPECVAAERPYLELLRSVVLRQARLIAQWMALGFIHGVMNTDNMAVSGETIDFGPCAFLDDYDPTMAFSAIDHRGRYAYDNQPAAAQWNLARFAETLVPLIDGDGGRAVELATAVIENCSALYAEHWLAGMRRKLGLVTELEGDAALVADLLEAMQRGHADFTVTFAGLSAAADGAAAADFFATAEVREWLTRWRRRRAQESPPPGEREALMRRSNPVVIPRNHRIEAVIVAATERGDFSPFHELHTVLASPYERQPSFDRYTQPPRPAERVLQTFCGT